MPQLRAGDVIQIGMGYHTEGPWVEDPEGRDKINVEWLDGVQDVFRYLIDEVGVHIVMAGKTLDDMEEDCKAMCTYIRTIFDELLFASSQLQMVMSIWIIQLSIINSACNTTRVQLWPGHATRNILKERTSRTTENVSCFSVGVS